MISIPVRDLLPTTEYTDGVLVDVIEVGRYKLLPTGKNRERWIFEVLTQYGDYQWVWHYFPKWSHPDAARAKFMREWLREDFDPAFLNNPGPLVNRVACLKLYCTFNSEDELYRKIIGCSPTTSMLKPSGKYFRPPPDYFHYIPDQLVCKLAPPADPIQVGHQ